MNRPLMFLIAGALLASVVVLARPVLADKCPEDDVGLRTMRHLNNHSRWAEMDGLFLEWTTLKCLDLNSAEDRNSVAYAARASRGLGDIGMAIARAKTIPFNTTLHKELPEQYAKVDLDFRDAPAPRTLVRTSPYPSINPAAVSHVGKALHTAGKVHNYLPPGTYTISSRTFTVAAGQSLSLTYLFRVASTPDEAVGLDPGEPRLDPGLRGQRPRQQRGRPGKGLRALVVEDVKTKLIEARQARRHPATPPAPVLRAARGPRKPLWRGGVEASMVLRLAGGGPWAERRRAGSPRGPSRATDLFRGSPSSVLPVPSDTLLVSP